MQGGKFDESKPIFMYYVHVNQAKFWPSGIVCELYFTSDRIRTGVRTTVRTHYFVDPPLLVSHDEQQ